MSFLAAAGIGGLSSLIGGSKQASAATQAAQTQAAASEYAANLQLEEANQANSLIQSIYNQNVTRLQPFVGAGYGGTAALQGQAGLSGQSPVGGTSTLQGLTAATNALAEPFKPTMAQLAQTPGYKFALRQGELGVGSQFSSMGLGGTVNNTGNNGGASLGPSGPLGKALGNYAEGLASTTFQNQFQNYLQQNAQIYNLLAGNYGLTSGTFGNLASMGENAAAQTGNMGTTAGGQSANALLTGAQGFGAYTTAGAAASAAGTVGSANALANATTGAGGSLSTALLYNALFGGNVGGTATASS